MNPRPRDTVVIVEVNMGYAHNVPVRRGSGRRDHALRNCCVRVSRAVDRPEFCVLAHNCLWYLGICRRHAGHAASTAAAPDCGRRERQHPARTGENCVELGPVPCPWHVTPPWPQSGWDRDPHDERAATRQCAVAKTQPPQVARAAPVRINPWTWQLHGTMTARWTASPSLRRLQARIARGRPRAGRRRSPCGPLAHCRKNDATK